MKEKRAMEGSTVRRMVFLVFFLALFLLVARLFYPFLTIILWSSLIYALLDPLMERLATRRDGREVGDGLRRLLAGLFAVGGVLIFVVPAVFLAISIVSQGVDLATSAIRAIEARPELLDLSTDGPIGRWIAEASKGAIDLSSIDIVAEVKAFIGGSAERLVSLSGALLRNATSLVLTLAFMIFTLYFLFADGRHLVRIVIGAMPIERAYTALFLRKLRDTSRQLVEGYFLVAIYQAVAAFVIFSLFGVKGPLALASLTAVTSFVPMIGTGLVWLPVSAARILGGQVGSGVALMLVSAFFISSLDNFIRPLILREKLQIHPLLIFFSIVGGIEILGFNGIILGPLILILFFTAVRLYDRVYDRPAGGGERDAESDAEHAGGVTPRQASGED